MLKTGSLLGKRTLKLKPFFLPFPLFRDVTNKKIPPPPHFRHNFSMKHKVKSASPCELVYSIDDPPRPVSTSENSSLSCPCCCTNPASDSGACHDGPNRLRPKRSEGPACSLNGLWQQNNSDHGRTVVCSDHHTGTPFLTSTGANSPSAGPGSRHG